MFRVEEVLLQYFLCDGKEKRKPELNVKTDISLSLWITIHLYEEIKGWTPVHHWEGWEQNPPTSPVPGDFIFGEGKVPSQTCYLLSICCLIEVNEYHWNLILSSQPNPITY